MNRVYRWLPIAALAVLVLGLLSWQGIRSYLANNPSSPIATGDHRLLDHLTLDNGVEVFLISDQQADRASWQWQGVPARGVTALASRPYQDQALADYVTAQGGQWKAFSGFSETRISASGRDVEPLLTMLGSLAADPVLSQPVDWRGSAIRNQRIFSSAATLVVTADEPLSRLRQLLPQSLAGLPEPQTNGRVEVGLLRTLPSWEQQARLSIPITGIARQPIEQALRTLSDISQAPQAWHIESDWLHLDYPELKALQNGFGWLKTLSQQWPAFVKYQTAVGCHTDLSERLLRLGEAGVEVDCLPASEQVNWPLSQVLVTHSGGLSDVLMIPEPLFSEAQALPQIWHPDPLPLVTTTYPSDAVVDSILYRPQFELLYQDENWRQWHRQTSSPVSQWFMAWQLTEADLASARLLMAAINAPQGINGSLMHKHVRLNAWMTPGQLHVRAFGPAQEIPGALTQWQDRLGQIGSDIDIAKDQLERQDLDYFVLSDLDQQAAALTTSAWLTALQEWLFSRPMIAMHDGPMDRQAVSTIMAQLVETFPGGQAASGRLSLEMTRPYFMLDSQNDAFHLYLARHDYTDAARQKMLLQWLEVVLRDYAQQQSPVFSVGVEPWQDMLRITLAADTDPGLLELHWRRFVDQLAQQVAEVDSTKFDQWRQGLSEQVGLLPKDPVLLAQYDWRSLVRDYQHLDEHLRHKAAIQQMSQDRFVRWLSAMAEPDFPALWHHQYGGQFGSYNRSEFTLDRLTIESAADIIDWNVEAAAVPSPLARD